MILKLVIQQKDQELVKITFFDYANARSNFPLEKLNKFVNFFKVNFDYVTGLSDNKIYYKGNIDLNLLKERLKKLEKKEEYRKVKLLVFQEIDSLLIGIMKVVDQLYLFRSYICLQNFIMCRLIILSEKQMILR